MRGISIMIITYKYIIRLNYNIYYNPRKAHGVVDDYKDI